jgi:hypothetical protein
MKYLLTDVISACQSAFVLGRMITNNIIVSFEMLHFLKYKRRGKVGQMAVVSLKVSIIINWLINPRTFMQF